MSKFQNNNFEKKLKFWTGLSKFYGTVKNNCSIQLEHYECNLIVFPQTQMYFDSILDSSVSGS